MPSFLLSSAIENPLFDSNRNLDNVSDKSTEFDFGGMLELGGSFKLNSQFLVYAAFNYQQSFTTLMSEDYFFPITDAYHYGFTAAVGLKYKL